MKIVMLARLFSPHVGGVEKHVKKVAEVCIQDGHEVHVFTLKHDETLSTFEKIDNIFVHRKPTQLHSRILKRILFALPGFPADVAKKLVERDEIWGWLTWNIWTFLSADIIHIHDVFFWYWPLRILLFWKPVYITFHGFEAGKLPTQKAKRARQLASRYTNGNIAVGSWIEKWYGTKPTFVTYGAGDCIQKPGLNKSPSKGRTKTIFVGRLESDTGIAKYVDVVTSTKLATLDIYGDGPLKNSLKETSTIHLRGKTDNACRLYPQYDLAFVSSYLSIIEAMQSRVLVVAYATDELKLDYLQSHPRADSMIIIERPEQLESFLKTFSPKQYEKEIERAYAWAKEQTWEQVYKMYLNLWRTELSFS